MPRIERDGVGIHYEATGSGPAVLLSHGYSATCRMWDAQVAALKDRYRVITWDMRGHGRSDYPEDETQYSEAHTVADMAAILNELGETRAVIGGLSLGGVMSLAFHLRHPEVTRALMLFDTGPGFKNAAARAEWNARAMQRATDLETRGIAALGERAETRAREHRDAAGLARAARGMLTQSGDPGADLGAGRQRGHELPCRDRLHGPQDSGRGKGGDPGRRPCRQSGQAGGVQRGGRKVFGRVG
jgi:pimeloyl-ACP methyl ester carboxylesterase